MFLVYAIITELIVIALSAVVLSDFGVVYGVINGSALGLAGISIGSGVFFLLKRQYGGYEYLRVVSAVSSWLIFLLAYCIYKQTDKTEYNSDISQLIPAVFEMLFILFVGGLTTIIFGSGLGQDRPK